VVRRILTAAGTAITTLIGNTAVLRSLRPTDFVDVTVGLPTITDILAELEKPGRDPRPAFATATFAEGVDKIADLKPGMVLEGMVTNVAAFGAFVDVGVHQDGLVHVSAMSKTFVKDPRDVVKPGDVVRVKVLDVDVPRNRITLTLRLEDPAEPKPPAGTSRKAAAKAPTDAPRKSAGKPPTGEGRKAAAQRPPAPSKPVASGALAEALRRAGYDA
jgi:uncharacterized protein